PRSQSCPTRRTSDLAGKKCEIANSRETKVGSVIMAVESYRRNVLPESQVEPKSGEKSGTRTRTRIVSLKKAETLVYLTLFVLIAAAAIFVLSLKMEAYELQTEKMQLENEIAIKEGEISELKTEVTHLASYDRIYEKANELGLDLNNGNVKVAEKYGKD